MNEQSESSTPRTVRGYELQERIGAGGFGEVYRAYQPSVGRQVAVKVILPQYANHPDFIRRFEKEAQLVARLEHPHIVPLYDYWRGADGAYLVMRWLRGGNLYDALQGGPWSPEAAASLLDQIAGALHIAHRQGVVHRDVKPENILLDQDGNAYLTDFGIAKDVMHATAATAPDAVPGSLLYISPEQAQGQPVTPQSDLYSLGVLLHEVLTGEHPFHGLTPTAVLTQLLTEPLPPLRERRPDLPGGLEEVIQRATAKEPGERYPDALAFAAAFREALSAPRETAVPVVEIPFEPPACVPDDAEEEERPVFVARERELERLDGFLRTALRGQGQVAFVTGGPGRGKTALLGEFARRAMDAHPDLLVALGDCNAYSGVGDPYLPFRDVMALLTGDVAGALTREHARRLWAALPQAAQALLDRGPHLVDVFVRGSALLSRATTAVGDEAPWLGPLRAHVQGQRVSSSGLEQSHLFEQLTNVLNALAGARPLLLILDDLQWADNASIGLLFHLGRRLANAGSPVLIACAYRPEEVALGRGGERHPLHKLLAEFKRIFGDVWVDVGGAEKAEGRRFVDAFLDTESNDLDEAFRVALFRHTGGHPLFTVELLRAMQERGDLVRDEDGRWVQGAALDWETLPARVEGVIEERIGRLEEELRDILTVASVEGEEFTAQVVARVGELGERGVLRALSQELEKRHRLVREAEALPLGRLRLSRYRFAHTLFQQYLYNDLSQGERALLHREVGDVLDALFEGREAEIAAQLAHHASRAGEPEREQRYARLAGERAAAAYANEEALRYLSRALELTPQTDAVERYALLLAREKVLDRQGDRDAQRTDLAVLESLADALGEDERRAAVALRRAWFSQITGDFSATVAAAQKVVHLAQAVGDVAREAAAHFEWGRAINNLKGDWQAAQTHFERAIELARAAEFRQASAQALSRAVETDSLRFLGYIFRGRDPDAAATYVEQALSISREIGDQPREGHALNTRALLAQNRANYSAARADFEQALRIYRTLGLRFAEAMIIHNLGDISSDQGAYAPAKVCYERALVINREIGNRQFEGNNLLGLGFVCRAQGDFAEAEAYFEQALHIYREVGNRVSEGFSLLGLGWMCLDQGDRAKAKAYFEQALHIHREIGDQGGEGWSLVDLGMLCRAQGDAAAAEAYAQDALRIVRELRIPDLQANALCLLGHALVSQARLDEAADAYRQALTLRREMNQPHLATEPQAGLACVALAKDDPGEALVHAEEILTHLETGSLDGTIEPFQIYLTCYRVLHANEDPRAEGVLETAHGLLQERAAKIEDEVRHRSFLENVAANRELVSEWRAARGESGD